MTMSCDGVSARPRRGCEMGRGWSAVLEAGLGDARTRMLGVFLIVVAVVGTVLMRSFGVGIATILEAQVPFTLYHLLSSLIFVPLFGSIFLFLHTYGWPARAPAAASKTPDRE